MSQPPLVEMIGIEKHFGGVRAVDHVSLDLFPGEVVGVLGHNGAGKSCLMRILAGAMIPNAGEIRVNGSPVSFADPNDAREAGIETIYQTLALADHLDAPSNLFLGRELKTRLGNLDDARMLAESRKVLARLNPNFKNLQDPVSSLSGGQRQVIAIARAIYFDTRVLIMDEPTAALGPSETAMVANLIRQLQSEGIGAVRITGSPLGLAGAVPASASAPLWLLRASVILGWPLHWYNADSAAAFPAGRIAPPESKRQQPHE